MKISRYRIENIILTILVSLVLGGALIFITYRTSWTSLVNWKIYDALMRIEYKAAHHPVSGDIVLITIDNDTLEAVGERWPYSRAKFATVIDNLKEAGAAAIGFDFIFYGRSSPEEDILLDEAVTKAGNAALGATIDEDGKLRVSTSTVITGAASVGIVTKMQDFDGVTRKSFTYLTQSGKSEKTILSWGLSVLGVARKDMICDMRDGGTAIECYDKSGGKWEIPVDKGTKSFLIHFRARTSDFKRISFYRVLAGDFDPALVRGKMALVGLTSSMFGDFHNTPIGWLPGITLNANALSALYEHDFLKEMPRAFDISLALAGLLCASLLMLFSGVRKTLVIIAAGIVLFLTAGFFLMTKGYTLEYSLFPIAIAIIPFLSNKLVDLIFYIWLNIKLRRGIWRWKWEN